MIFFNDHSSDGERATDTKECKRDLDIFPG